MNSRRFFSAVLLALALMCVASPARAQDGKKSKDVSEAQVKATLLQIKQAIEDGKITEEQGKKKFQDIVARSKLATNGKSSEQNKMMAGEQTHREKQ